MRRFQYARAATVDDALALARDGAGRTRWLAGGTDLVPMMKADLLAPERLVDIKRIAELNGGIEVRDAGVRIGALTTLAEIERSDVLAARLPLLVEAARQSATPQLRRMASLGGNLMQRPRCAYFRHPDLVCWLEGGDACLAEHGENEQHALFREGPCCAVHPSDIATCLVALDAAIVVRDGAGAERTLNTASFFAEPAPDRRTETTLGDDDLIVAVSVPAPPDGTRSLYVKATERKAWSFATAAIAATLRIRDGAVAEIGLAAGGVAPVPLRLSAAEAALRGRRPDAAAIEQAADAALAGAAPLADNAYKVPLTKALLRRALTQLGTHRSPDYGKSGRLQARVATTTDCKSGPACSR